MAPRPASPEPRNNVISVRLSDSEYAAAVEAAEKADTPLGTWTRQLVNRGSGHKPRRRPARLSAARTATDTTPGP